MNQYYFPSKGSPRLATKQDWQSPDGIFWFDVSRQDRDWSDKISQILGIEFYPQHVQDSLSTTHAPFYDGTEKYDLLIVRSLDKSCDLPDVTTIPVAFFITHRAIITVRSNNDEVFSSVIDEASRGNKTVAGNVDMWLWRLLNELTNQFLKNRERITDQLTGWQDKLFAKNSKFQNWESLMKLRSSMRRLEQIMELQLEVLSEWRAQTAIELHAAEAIRFNDLQEHVSRVHRHVELIQNDIDALVNIYFSASTQRTNDILKFLAIISAIFLPLNLLAAIFGMNFTNMPMLSWSMGPYVLFSGMLLIVVLMIYLFSRKNWIKIQGRENNND